MYTEWNSILRQLLQENLFVHILTGTYYYICYHTKYQLENVRKSGWHGIKCLGFVWIKTLITVTLMIGTTPVMGCLISCHHVYAQPPDDGHWTTSTQFVTPNKMTDYIFQILIPLFWNYKYIRKMFIWNTSCFMHIPEPLTVNEWFLWPL